VGDLILDNPYFRLVDKLEERQSKALPLLQKMGELVCSQHCPQSIDVSSIFTEFEQQR
jgi:hypothetical protein